MADLTGKYLKAYDLMPSHVALKLEEHELSNAHQYALAIHEEWEIEDKNEKLGGK